MQPYIYSSGKGNSVACSCDLIIADRGTPLLISMLDINIVNKKICSDLIQKCSLTIKDRENINFQENLYVYQDTIKYKHRSTKQEDLTHTIITSSLLDKDYVIDWDNQGLVKSVVSYLRNKEYLPITEEIMQEMIDMQNKENEKYSHHQEYIATECNVYTNNPTYEYLKCYKVNVSLIKRLLNKINLNSDIKDNFNWNEIETIEDYIVTFLNPIKNKINNNVEILYNKDKVSNHLNHGEKKPFDGQIPVIQGAIEVLKRDRFVYISADMGFGKSPCSIKVMNAYYREINKENPIIFINAPSITLTQWEEEIKAEYGKSADVIIIKKTDKFIQWYNKTRMKVNKPTFILCGKETFKLQYKLTPAINIKKMYAKKKVLDEYWARGNSPSTAQDYMFTEVIDKTEKACCPTCGKPLKNPLRKFEDVFFNEDDFKGKPKKSNYKCSECGDILWSATYDKTKKTSVIDFIKRKKIMFDMVVCDEVHESNNIGSIISNATRTILRNHCKKSILLSGTPNNGYASSLYNILFALMPNKLIDNNIYEEKDFIAKYGTLQAITKKNDNNRKYYYSGKAEIKESDFKEIEGVNPIVFTKFLSSNFINADLSDLGKDLPSINEYYIPINHTKELLDNERKLFDDIKEANSFNAKMYLDSIIKHYINNPFDWLPITIETTEKKHEIQPICIDNQILPKEEKILEIIDKELKENRKCWIYVDFNNGGQYMDGEKLPNRIERILKEKGYKVFQLKPSVKTYERKEVIDKNKDKYDVFIGNRKLTQVGLNLQFCPTYINYCPSYMVNEVDQANRRGMRANSTVENRIYNLYYKDTCEDEIIKRYQRKLAESKAIVGKFNVTLEDDASIRTASQFSKEINKSINN